MALIVAASWAARRYFGENSARAVVPYAALLGVLALCGYHQTEIDDLKMEIQITEQVLNQRIAELEAIVNGPQDRAILDEFEKYQLRQRKPS